MILCLPPLSYGQALQNRSDPAQQRLRSQALVAGQTGEATWPQPSPDSDVVTAGSEFALDLDLGFRQGEDALWKPRGQTFTQDRPFAIWTLHLEQAGHWGLALGADYSDRTEDWQATSLVWPTEESAIPLEPHFLHRGWLWYDFSPLQIEIGRNQIHWSPLSNSLLVSDRIPFLDMIRARVGGGPWTLDWVVATPETRRTGQTNLAESLLMNLHRIEYRQPQWRFAVSELYLVHRVGNGPYTIADVLPVMVQHQSDMNPNNNLLIFDAEWLPTPGWRFMGQWGWDEMDAEVVGIPDNDIPTIWAFQIGVESQVSLEAPLWSVEAGYTHYLWGNFDDPVAKAQYRLVLFERSEAVPLTSPYGPGTAWINARVAWSTGALDLEARGEWFTTKDGVTLDLPYERNGRYEGLGSVLQQRATLTVGLRTGDWRFTLEPSFLAQGGEVGYEVRLGLTRLWSTQGPSL